MHKIRILTFIVLSLLLIVGVSRKSSARRQSAPKFTSAYTDLNRDCKSALTKKEEKEAEARGMDIPLRCKGYGGYYVDISYSAMASSISIYMNGSDDSISLGMFPLNYSDEKGRKIEWRMADGKPFAVIMRVSNYKDEAGADGGNPFDPKYKTGESLVVKGLKGYEKIDFTVDVMSVPNPNEKARQLADENYAK